MHTRNILLCLGLAWIASAVPTPLNINLGAYSPALVVGDGAISFGGAEGAAGAAEGAAAEGAAAGEGAGAAGEGAGAAGAGGGETTNQENEATASSLTTSAVRYPFPFRFIS